MDTSIYIHDVKDLEIGVKKIDKSSRMGDYYTQRITITGLTGVELELNLFYPKK